MLFFYIACEYGLHIVYSDYQCQNFEHINGVFGKETHGLNIKLSIIRKFRSLKIGAACSFHSALEIMLTAFFLLSSVTLAVVQCEVYTLSHRAIYQMWIIQTIIQHICRFISLIRYWRKQCWNIFFFYNV